MLLSPFVHSHPRKPPRLLDSSQSFGLIPRVLVLAVLFVAELLLLSIWLDNAAVASRGGIMGFVGHWGPWIVRGIVGFATIFFTFAYLKNGAALAVISKQTQSVPVGPGFLAAHFMAMAAFGALSWALYGNHLGVLSAQLLASLWLIAGGCGIGFGACSLSPLTLWVQLVRETGSLWIGALAAVVSACAVGGFSQSLWTHTTYLTFGLVKAFLSLFVSRIVSNPASMTLGTEKFAVTIAPECSGLEGAGLMLAFGLIWLWLFRQECRFPRALVLVPMGVAAVFSLNAARITVLILIGNAGAEQIALGGFHSQAGWIALNAVALGFSVAARRLPWLAAVERPVAERGGQSFNNPTVSYLLPFLGILAVGIVTAAVSADFQWLYPIRFLAAAGVLWILRKRYLALDWKFSWFGPAIGVLVFALWIAMDSFLHAPAAGGMPPALAASTAPVRVTWIVFRILSAAITVPIAEELAFRGFLLRRLISEDFETLPFRTFTWTGLLISSVAFGLLHGDLWFVGILAGFLYAWALVRRGSIGEAVIAHATTNALLAVYVLAYDKWHLWS